jgi:hypothetical protein
MSEQLKAVLSRYLLEPKNFEGKIEELKSFVKNLRESSNEERGKKTGTLIGERVLFIEGHILEFHRHFQAYMLSQGRYSNQKGFYKDFAERLEPYSDLTKPENQQLIDGIVDVSLSTGKVLDNLKLLLSSDRYYPRSENPLELLGDLIVLYIFYKYLAVGASLNILLQIDLVMAQIMFQVAISFSVLNQMGTGKDGSRKGGKKPKRLEGILLAIRKVQEGRKNYSAERLWDVFKKNHKGQRNAIKMKKFKVYFDYKDMKSLEERLHQLSSNGLLESIGRSAFAGYVKEIKASLK